MTDITQIRFLGDPTAKWTEALDLAFDGTAIFGGPRSKRYALLIEDGKVKEAFVEPDNTGISGKGKRKSRLNYTNRIKCLLPRRSLDEARHIMFSEYSGVGKMRPLLYEWRKSQNQ
jgi:hypothetical protein